MPATMRHAALPLFTLRLMPLLRHDYAMRLMRAAIATPYRYADATDAASLLSLRADALPICRRLRSI